jgi:O-antigen/teichoic acid export membrane protein
MASVIDQALLSGLSFLIGLALIRFASKETYGLYSQLYGVGLLTTTLLGALIGSALNTLASRLPADERLRFVARTARLQWLASSLLAVIAGLAVGAITSMVELTKSPVLLALSFTAFIFAQGCREYCRTALFIESRADAVARMDLVFVLTTILGASVFLVDGDISVPLIFFLLALSNGIASLWYSATLWRSTPQETNWEKYRADARRLWSLSRWAVIGSVVGWLGNNSYLYFAGVMAGVAALAELNAARLLLIPIVIVGMAWVTVARPAMGQMIANAEHAKLRAFVLKSTVAMGVFAVAYVAILFVSFPWLSGRIFGDKYSDLSHLMLLWGVYFAANVVRNVGTVLLTSYGTFRDLFWQGIVSLIILLAASMALTPVLGVAGALSAMILVELWELVVNYVYLLPRARRQNVNTS